LIFKKTFNLPYNGSYAIQSGAKFKEAFLNEVKKTKDSIKKGVTVVKKILDTPETKNVINMLTEVVGIPVFMADIIYKGADIVASGMKIGENMFPRKPQKDILKNNNKFDLKNKFNQISDLIKTRMKIE
jgi:hypothetical protein